MLNVECSFSSLGPGSESCAFNQEVCHHLFVTFVGDDPPVVCVKLVATLAQQIQEIMDLLQITIPDRRWFRHQGIGVLHIHEAHGAVKLEVELSAVEQMKNREVMLLESQMLETPHQFCRIAEEVRQ